MSESNIANHKLIYINTEKCPHIDVSKRSCQVSFSAEKIIIQASIIKLVTS